MTKIIDAIFNGKVFEPSSQVNLKPNTKVKITIEEENVEFDHEVALRDRTYTFLKTARNLSIDSPADFSEKIDSYLESKQYRRY